MADRAHILTDKELEEMERHLSAIYARAEKELQEKVDNYFKRFEEMDAKKRALVDAGKLTEEEYKRWRQNKIMTGRHWKQMKEQAAQELLQANRTAQEYINGRLPGVYSLNYNSTGEAIEGAVSGYSFELVDASTVRHLATTDKTLLPYKYVDGKKDVRWNTAKVNAEVLQGIVQGESIPNIAKRLQNVTEMNRASAIRNARTTVTSAENKGRMDMLHDAADKGVIVHKVWMAAIDARTRETHRLLDGQEQEIDDPFESELGDIMFPGDPSAAPANTYNCRCSLGYKVVGFEKQTNFADNSFASEIQNTELSPYYRNYDSYKEFKEAKKNFGGKETDYLEDVFRGKVNTNWYDVDEKVPRIEHTIAELEKKYPMSGERITVCDYDSAHLYLPKGLEDRRLEQGGAIGQVFVNDGHIVVAFDRNYMYRSFADDLAEREASIKASKILDAVGSSSPEGVSIHEWGHVIDEHITTAMINDDNTAIEYWEWYKSLTKQEIREGISDYAATNRSEFAAECFEECMMPNPRPIALKFKEYLDEIMRKGY